MSGSLDLKAVLEKVKVKNAGPASASVHDYKTNPFHELKETSYRLIQAESKDKYDTSDIDSFFKLLPQANGDILIALDKKDILIPGKYQHYNINVPNENTRRIQYIPPNAQGETRYFSHYNFSEVNFDSNTKDLASQIADVYFKISKLTQGKFIFIYGSEATIKRAHLVLFLFLLLDDFDAIFFTNSFQQPASNLSSKIEFLKKQGIAFTDEQIEALVKCAVKAKEYLEKAAQEAALVKRRPTSLASQEKKSTAPSPMAPPTIPWTQKITEGLWKYRVIIAAILMLLILLTLSALFWPVMVGFAFTVVEMASAILAAKIATLFIVAFLGLCLMDYIKRLEPSMKGWSAIPLTDENIPSASAFQSPTIHKFRSGKTLIPKGLQVGKEKDQTYFHTYPKTQ